MCHTSNLRFAYRRGWSMEGTVASLMHSITTHLGRPKAYTRVLFVDFSSAFSTVQPHLLVQMQVNKS